MIVGLSFETVRWRVRNGTIPSMPRIKPGQHFRISASTIEAMFPDEWNSYLANNSADLG